MWELVRANRRRAAILVVFMAVLLAAMGYALGYYFGEGAEWYGLGFALVLWGILALTSFSGGDSMILSLSHARRIEKAHHPVLLNVVEEMSIASGLAAMPEIYIIDEAAPNAFATGRGKQRAAVAVTSGLLEKLDRDELQGVIAHELAHIKNRDVLYMTTLTIMVGTIVILAHASRRMLWFGGGGRRRTSDSRGGGQAELILAAAAILLMILAPIIARFLYLAVSRKKEYIADGCSAQFTRYPEGLASALEKIGGSTERMVNANQATAPMYIVNPLARTERGLADLSSTHPPISQRIAILRSLAGELGPASYDAAYRRVTRRPVGVFPRAQLAESPAPGGARGVEPAASRGPGIEAPGRSRAEAASLATPQGRVRASTDALWQLGGFIFIPCACGTKLKVPPELAGRTIPCPHCGRSHSIAA